MFFQINNSNRQENDSPFAPSNLETTIGFRKVFLQLSPYFKCA